MAIQAITTDLGQGGPVIQRVEPIETNNSWDHLIDEMDAIDDPFEKMAFALYMLMPAILDDKEEQLDGRADDLEGLSEVTTAAAEIHEMFNDFKKFGDVGDWTGANAAAQEMKKKLGDLKILVQDGIRDPKNPEAGGFIDETLALQVNESIDEMIHWIETEGDSNGVGVKFTQIWDANPDYTRMNEAQYTDGKFWLDHLNTVETSFKSVSGVAQTEMQYEIGFYEVMVGTYKDMFQNYKGQVQSAVDGSKR